MSKRERSSLLFIIQDTTLEFYEFIFEQTQNLHLVNYQNLFINFWKNKSKYNLNTEVTYL
jgi:hypothetical protein